jgi:hypothetical protein
MAERRDWYGQLQAAASSAAGTQSQNSHDAALRRHHRDIFQADATKTGLIETNADGETIRWMNNSCYTTLTTDNPLHRGMLRCVMRLGQRQARADLFADMK